MPEVDPSRVVRVELVEDVDGELGRVSLWEHLAVDGDEVVQGHGHAAAGAVLEEGAVIVADLVGGEGRAVLEI